MKILDQTIKNATSIGLFFLLLSCDTIDISNITSSEEPPECPQVSVPPDVSTITRFIEGFGESLIDIDFTAEITEVKGECTYKATTDSGYGSVEIKIITKFAINRGAANTSRRADFDYFISVLDSNKEVLDMQPFTFSAEYSGNRLKIKKSSSPVKLSIPLISDQTGQDYFVYVGFQLSQRELEYNRRVNTD